MRSLIRLYPLILTFFTLCVMLNWWREPRRPRWLLLACLSLVLVSWPPFARLTLGAIEWVAAGQAPDYRGADKASAAADAQAIVVLSGWVQGPEEVMPESRLGFNTATRCGYAAYLHREWRDLPVLATGGPVHGHPELSHGEVMGDFLMRWGVEPDVLWTERKSRSTRENATFSAEILRSKGIERIVLVTEAYHMPRSVACFEALGFTVYPAPCGFRSLGRPWRWDHLIPTYHAVEDHELLFHEVVGMVFYWWRGWIWSDGS